MRPNFFMPGAPKCGTTAMASYLSAHPEVFMSTPKEPAFFNQHVRVHRSQIDVPGHHNDERAYLDLFRDVGPQHRVIGEATTTYLMDPQAIAQMAAFAPSAKIVVMLRNPVDLVYAFHSEMLKSANETEADFATAWALQGDRAAGRHIPASTRKPSSLQYGRVGQLGRQVDTLLGYYSPEQVLITLYDDLKTDTGEVYRQVLRFLQLPDDGRTDFSVVNPNKQFTQSRLMRWLKSDTLLRQGSQRMKRKLGRESWGVYEALLRRRSVVAPRPPMDDELRRELTGYFHDDVLSLENRLGRDLSMWRSPPGVHAS